MIYLIEKRNGHLTGKEETYIKNYCKENNLPFLLFSLREMRRKKCSFFENKFIPVGGISFIQAAMVRLGLPKINPNDYPYCFDYNDYQRSIPKIKYISDIGENDLPIFIKPSEKLKQFTGFILTDLDDVFFKTINPKVKVWTSEAIKLVQEWRVYFYTSVNCGRNQKYHYFIGNHLSDTIQPPQDIHEPIRKLLDKYAKSNTNMNGCLDIGLTEENNYCVIETNPGFALGYYFSDSKYIKDYFTLITQYWLTLLRENKK